MMNHHLTRAHMRISFLLLLVSLHSCTSSQASRIAAGDVDLMIRGVNVVDVEAGALLRDRTVMIRGNRITDVVPAANAQVPPGVRVIDGAGRYLIPGMWDTHTHLNGAAYDSTIILPTYVANGVTGIRDLWSDPPGVVDSAGVSMLDELRRIRDHVRAGRVVGPRILLASAPLDGPHGPDPYVHVVRTQAEARAIVDASAASGVDIIAMYRWLSPAAYAAAAEAARRHGLPLAGGAPVAATFAEVRAAGQSVRDGYAEWEIACSTAGDSLRAVLRTLAERDSRDASIPAEESMAVTHRGARPLLQRTFDVRLCRLAAAAAAGEPVWYATRLVYGMPLASRGEHAATGDRLMPADVREARRVRTERIQADSGGTVSAAARREREIFRILHDAGIPFLVASESYFGGPAAWGFSVHDELVELVGIGLTPAHALRAATLNPAHALGMADSLGTVEAGKIADLVLLDANPLDDIRHARRIHAVVLNGRLFDRPALDWLLAEVGRAAEAFGSQAGTR